MVNGHFKRGYLFKFIYSLVVEEAEAEGKKYLIETDDASET